MGTCSASTLIYNKFLAWSIPTISSARYAKRPDRIRAYWTMCACMMRCPRLRAWEHGLAPAPAVMFSTLEGLVDVRCSDVRRTERYRTDKREGSAQAQVHTTDSVGAKAGHDAPWRKALSVNSTTSRRTPPPGASRSTFGTKPLYSAAGPSSRKIVTSLRARREQGGGADGETRRR